MSGRKRSERDGPPRDTRLRAALGYPVAPLALHALLTGGRRDPFLRYHAVQSLALVAAGTVVFAALGLFLQAVPLVRVLTLLGTPLALGGWIVYTTVCAARAYRGELFTIPFLSPFLRCADLEV